MDYVDAIKGTMIIYKRICIFPFNIQKQIRYNIEHYNYIKGHKDINIILELLNENGYKYIQLEKEYKSYINKKTRIKKRINRMDKNNIWFCTWTIEDKYLNKNHRRKLKELYKGKKYIINVDSGKTTKRKHYHGIIESEEEPIKWNYGFCLFKKVKLNNESKDNIAKYINKLTNHSIKAGTEEEKIIYSR